MFKDFAASYEIEHSCGHTVRHTFYGKDKADTDKQARRAFDEPCHYCKQESEIAAAEAQYSFPELFGSEKQVKWAKQIRFDYISAWEAIAHTLPQNGRETFREFFFSERKAGTWIRLYGKDSKADKSLKRSIVAQYYAWQKNPFAAKCFRLTKEKLSLFVSEKEREYALPALSGSKKQRELAGIFRYDYLCAWEEAKTSVAREYRSDFETFFFRNQIVAGWFVVQHDLDENAGRFSSSRSLFGYHVREWLKSRRN